MDKRPDYNELLSRSKRGDKAAKEELFLYLKVRLRLVLKYRLRGWAAEELDDILQDTLTVVVERLEQVESNPDLFALEVMRNKIGNRIGSRRRRVQIPIDPTDGGDGEDENGMSRMTTIPSEDSSFAAVENRDLAEQIRKAIRQLSPLCQALFTALLENRSVAETWELFHTVQGTLQRSTFDKRLFDCRRKLRQIMARSL